MSLPAKFLEIKTSTLPNAGKGLFVTVAVPKGSLIVEYLGRKTNWADVENDADNGYIYHIDDNNVIDASKNLKSFGRYANDAAGLSKLRGVKNNAVYHEEGTRVFIKATRDIAAGSEIFVAYGKDYWKQLKENIKIDAANKKAKGSK
ncbi:MAG: SET domain-containing protein [Niabella sp.]